MRIKIIFQIVILLLLYSCYSFLSHTKGLLYTINNKNFGYVNDLQSSGDEDNLFIIPIIFIYAILFFCSLFMNDKKIFYASLFCLLIFIFSLLFIQVGGIINTIFKDSNYALLLIVVLPFMISYISYKNIKL